MAHVTYGHVMKIAFETAGERKKVLCILVEKDGK
jgi:hypothetical protein